MFSQAGTGVGTAGVADVTPEDVVPRLSPILGNSPSAIVAKVL